MKIVIINNGLAGGGIERASTSMANQFSKWGHDVHLVALYKSEHFLPINSSIHFVEPNRERWSYLYALYMMYYVRKQIKHIQPDTILAYGEWTNPYVLFALQGLRIPTYVSDRMSPLISMPKLTKFLKKIYYKRCSGVIAQTEFAKKIIVERNDVSNIKVIPNPVNPIDPISCEKFNYIITIGRLTKEKGHKCLIEALSLIKHRDWSLSIVGDGIEKDNLVQLVSSLGLDQRVFFHGHKLNFAKEISEAKIFVLPSLSEGFPNAVIEAMSVPIPCIVTRCTEAMDELIKDGINGILVEKNNPQVLADAIDRLIDDESLQNQLSVNSFKVREELAFERIAAEYLNYISSY